MLFLQQHIAFHSARIRREKQKASHSLFTVRMCFTPEFIARTATDHAIPIGECFKNLVEVDASLAVLSITLTPGMLILNGRASELSNTVTS